MFLICSDGLTDMVTDDAILETVERYRGNLDRMTKQLVAAANKGGGEDNITVVAFSIGDQDGAAELGDTATMQAVSYAPDDKTTENVQVRATPAPGRSAGRVRVVFASLVVLALLVSLLLWGLLR